MTVSTPFSSLVPADRLKTIFVLAGVFLFAFFTCFSLATREPVYPPNQGVIELPVEGMASKFLGEYGEGLVEPEGPLSVKDVATRSDWEKLNTRYIGFGAISQPIWIRAELKNLTDRPLTVRFDTRRVAFKRMQMFLSPDNGDTVQTILDYSYEAPFSERPVNHRILVTDAILAANESTTLYVRYRGIYNSVLPMRLASPQAFERADKHEVFWASMSYGLIGATFFLILLTWWLTGWRLSLSFGFFLLSSLLSIWSVEGYIDQLIIPTKTVMTARLTDTLYLINYGAILLISRNIFDLKTKAPRLDRVSIWAINAIFAFAAFHFFIGVPARDVFVPMALTARVSSLALHAYVGIWAVLNRENGGTAFSLSAVLLTVASIYMVMDETFGFPYGGIPFTLRWLVNIEIIAFATAIAQHVFGIRRERDAALKADLAATRERLRLSEALQQSQTDYQRARDRAGELRERLQTVSHDILQPLSSLKASVASVDPKSMEKGQALAEAFDYLEALATQNLPNSQVATAPVVDKEDVPLSLILSSVVAMFAEDAHKKGLDLTYVDNVTDDCLVDPLLTMRAVSNLVSNSIRHTQEGEIRITATLSADAIRIEVRDTGEGMTTAQLTSFLQSGVKGETSTGSGLGLAIVRDTMEQMGGDFDITSTKDEGTLATLKLPLSDQPDQS